MIKECPWVLLSFMFLLIGARSAVAGKLDLGNVSLKGSGIYFVFKQPPGWQFNEKSRSFITLAGPTNASEVMRSDIDPGNPSEPHFMSLIPGNYKIGGKLFTCEKENKKLCKFTLINGRVTLLAGPSPADLVVPL